MASEDHWAFQSRVQLSSQYNFNAVDLGKLSESEKVMEQKRIEATWKNLRFHPAKELDIYEGCNIRDCFRSKILSPLINKKRLATLAFDFYTTKQPDRYVQNFDKTVQLRIFGLYEAALLGEDNYFALLKNSSKNLLKSKAEFGRSLLYTSARSGYEKCVFQLLKIGCDVNEIQENGSTPLHVAAFYGHEDTVKILVAFGASNQIRNQYGNTPQDEAQSEKIVEIFNIVQQDNIYLLFNQLKEMGLAFSLDRRSNDQIIRIYKKGKNQEALIKHFRNNPKYKRTFHGTQFANLQSIFEHGLQPPGTSIGENIIEIQFHHIKQGIQLHGIHDWGNAVFVSPSPFYASNNLYAERILCNGRIYCCLVEAMIVNNPRFFDAKGPTIREYGKPLGEPENVEIRVDQRHKETFQRLSLGNEAKEMQSLDWRDSSTCNEVIKGFDFKCKLESSSKIEKKSLEYDEQEEEHLLNVFSILFIDEQVLQGQLEYEEVIKLVEKYDII